MVKFFLVLLVIFAGSFFVACENTVTRWQTIEVDPNDWLGNPPGITDSMVAPGRIYNTQIVVIGAGASGLAAARAAAEQLDTPGAVIVVEREAGLHSRGIVFGAINTNWQAELYDLSAGNPQRSRLIRNDAEKMEIARVMWQMSGHRASMGQWTRWAFESGAAFDWFEDAFYIDGSPWKTGVPAIPGVAAFWSADFDFPTMGPQKGYTAPIAQPVRQATIPGVGFFAPPIPIPGLYERNPDYPWFASNGDNRRGFYLQFAWPGQLGHPHWPSGGITPQLPHFSVAHNFQTGAGGMDGNWRTALRSQQWVAERHHADFRFMHDAVELIVEDGEVVGVFVEDINAGVYIRINASRGVILATGDYSANPVMVRALNPEFIAVTGALTAGPARNDGTGHRMAIWAGAMMEPGPHPHVTHSQGGAPTAALFPILALNAHGNRFMNENSNPYMFTLQVGRQPNRTRIQVIDSRIEEMIPELWTEFHGSTDFFNLGFLEALNLPAGAAAHPTLESLVAAMYPPTAGTAQQVANWRENAVNAILRYNHLAGYRLLSTDPVTNVREWVHVEDEFLPGGAANTYFDADWEQVDIDFGKESRMWALVRAPFFHGSGLPATGSVKGGIMISDDFRVLRAMPWPTPGGAEAGLLTPGEPIPGLWAVGNVAGGRFAGAYAVNAAATSHGTAVTFGRHAGHVLAGGVAADLRTVPGGARNLPGRPTFEIPADANDFYGRTADRPLAGSITIAGAGTPAQVGNVLTASYVNTPVGHPNIGTGEATWTWLRGATVIAGADSATYTLQAADVGYAIRARVQFPSHTGSVVSVPITIPAAE